MNALSFFCFQYACDSGNAKFKDSRNQIVNKGSGKRSSRGHNTCVPNHPETSTLYTLWVLLCLGEKKPKTLCVDFWLFYFSTRFVHALHSSVQIYLEIENLIGLGGVFNNKLDLWVLFFKKGQRKGIFIYYSYYYSWMNLLFIFHTDPRRPHPPWSFIHTINKKIVLCFMKPSLPFCCESKFTFLPGRITCSLFATCP
jgi:hypothetical protein